MQIHEIKTKTKRLRKTLVGRGGKRGKTSGRGGKGQTARAGHKTRPEWRDIIKKMPKLRGRGKNINTPITTKSASVKISDIEKNFNAGETVSPASLFAKNLIKKVGGKFPTVKVVSNGDLAKKVVFKNCNISATALEKITKSGSSVK